MEDKVVEKWNIAKIDEPMSHRKIGSIDPGVCPLIDGNQIQDGGSSGHLG
jgi:hypothetical protein